MQEVEIIMEEANGATYHAEDDCSDFFLVDAYGLADFRESESQIRSCKPLDSPSRCAV